MTDTAEKIENDVRAALAADVQSQYDETVTVVDYQAVVQVMLEDGTMSLRRVYSGDPLLSTQLAHAMYAVKGVEFLMNEEFAAEWAGPADAS